MSISKRAIPFQRGKALRDKQFEARAELSSTYPRTSASLISKGGSVSDIAADKEVILAAGAINSPRLLMPSGVGESEGASQPCNRRRRETVILPHSR